jgi:hypothetical protein
MGPELVADIRNPNLPITNPINRRQILSSLEDQIRPMAHGIWLLHGGPRAHQPLAASRRRDSG